MSEINAASVKQLRDLTGLGMMECKKALQESGGDLKKAEDLLRIKSGSKATKVAGRVAAEGAVGIHVNSDKSIGVLVEVNCETDFVGKDAGFRDFVDVVAKTACENKTNTVEDLLQKTIDGETIESIRQKLVMKLGENMAIRRVVLVQAKGELSFYLHGTKIGVIVDLEGGDSALGKDLSMHVAAMKPIAVSEAQVPSETLEREREIARGRALESGKPQEIIDKIVEGSIRKYLSEVTLLGQSFVKDDKQSVASLVNSNSAEVHSFKMFVVGEGIEKKVSDFAAEVEAQAASRGIK